MTGLLPGLGARPTAVLDAERRRTFASLFPTFGEIVTEFCLCGGLAGVSKAPATALRAQRLMHDHSHGWPGNGVVVMAGLFASHVMRMRGRIEAEARKEAGVSKPSAVEHFGAATDNRFRDLSEQYFEDFEVNASQVAQAMLISYQRLVMAQILDSIRAEAVLGIADWCEGEFFRSVFLGLADTDPAGYVVRGFQPVFLDHVEAYKAAVSEDIATTARAAFQVHEGGKAG